MNLGVVLAEHGLLPTPVVRFGIRRLLEKRLDKEALRFRERDRALGAWTAIMARSNIAPRPDLANRQHYEVPARFFELTLGPQLKYSSGLWVREGMGIGEPSVATLAEAEEAMLELTAEHALLADGQRILELGCGWGSLSLWMARRYPNASIVGVSNSSSQKAFIESRAKKLGLANLRIVTADVNDFEPGAVFDRVVSVEMFEHLRNWGRMLGRVRRWVEADGSVFLHVFAHRAFAYPFEDSADDDWMGRHFFSEGMMPSVDLLEHVDSPFQVESRWTINGENYARTARAWLQNLDTHREEIEQVLDASRSAADARRLAERWRIFFLACDELFGYRGGSEWVVSHARLRPRTECS